MKRMNTKFEKVSDTVVAATGHPVHFLFSLLLLMLWVVSGPFFHFSDTWQLIINTGTTVVTWLLVILIQNAQNRNDFATHTKLDAIIEALDGVPNVFIALEHLSSEEIKELEKKILEKADENDA